MYVEIQINFRLLHACKQSYKSFHSASHFQNTREKNNIPRVGICCELLIEQPSVDEYIELCLVYTILCTVSIFFSFFFSCSRCSTY